MGKTTVSKLLAHLGCAVHNSDTAVHKALMPHGNAFEAVALTFPEAWDKKKHVIKSDVLAKIIFSDEAQKRKLENILHPIAQQSQINFLQRQKRLGRKIAVLDIPLLFETGAEKRVDYTLVATAPYAIQHRRVLKRPNMSEEKFQAIVKSQMSDSEKCKRADYIVHTGMGMAYTYRALQEILRDIGAA